MDIKTTVTIEDARGSTSRRGPSIRCAVRDSIAAHYDGDCIQEIMTGLAEWIGNCIYDWREAGDPEEELASVVKLHAALLDFINDPARPDS